MSSHSKHVINQNLFSITSNIVFFPLLLNSKEGAAHISRTEVEVAVAITPSASEKSWEGHVVRSRNFSAVSQKKEGGRW
jgi:heptaprenylglyceryl phosphate synthase